MNATAQVLIVDDVPHRRVELGTALHRLGVAVQAVSLGSAIVATRAAAPAVVVIVDEQAAARADDLRAHSPRTPIVALGEPYDVDACWEATRAALAASAQREQDPASATPPPPPAGGIVGEHPMMRSLLERAERAALSHATVLILGETGCGKEEIAGLIHARSRRARGPFVRLNCAALSPTVIESELFGHERGAFTGATAKRLGRLEQANGGTLFLDEVSEIPAPVQVKLLRFLQEREIERVGGNATVHVSVRVLAASNRNLRKAIDSGEFRADLYYRLNVVRLDVPPLRMRTTDIDKLAHHFLERSRGEGRHEPKGFTDAALAALRDYSWPGNVRELENAVEQATVLCTGELIEVGDLPGPVATGESGAARLSIPGSSLADLERFAIERTLAAVGGSTSDAARALGVSRRTIQYRMRQWDLRRPRARE